MTLDRPPQFPPRFVQPLRRAARGEPAAWPASMNEVEKEAIALHGMLPLILRLSGLQSQAERMTAAALESLSLADLRGILSALARRHCPVLILKGTALAYSVYSEPELRPRGDIDLLAEPANADLLREVFASLDFEAPLTSGDELGYRQQSFVRTDTFGARHVYDVHYAITNSAVTADSLSWAEMRDRAVVLPAISDDALVPCTVDSLMHACIHRAIHHHDSERLIWLYDVHLLLDVMSPAEHEEFWRRAAERDLVTICRRAIELADGWFAREPRDLSSDFLTDAQLSRPEPAAAFLLQDRTAAAVLATDLAALGGRARLQRLWQLAFPPPAFMMRQAPGRSRLLLPWLYARRAARGVVKLFRRA